MSEAPAPPPALLWLDVETTGLDENVDYLLEVGIILTGWDLDVIAETSFLVYQSVSWPVSEFIAAMHGDAGSGLLTACRSAVMSAWDVDNAACDWLTANGCPPEHKPLLAGRNVHFDRRWLRHDLPALHERVSHRSLDVTSLRLAMAEWSGATVAKDANAGAHRALADLHADIAVARKFRDVLRQAADDRRFLSNFFHTDGV